MSDFYVMEPYMKHIQTIRNKALCNAMNLLRCTRSLILIGVFVLTSQLLPAQLFVELPNHNPGLAQAEAVWLSSGGKLHPLVSGETKAVTNSIKTLLLKQTAKNTFTTTRTNLPDFIHGSMDVADFNRDGFEDVLLSGAGPNNKTVSGIYLQQANGSFQRMNQNIPALIDGSVQFGDFDKDGDLDVLISGNDASGSLQTIVLRNDNGKLTDINAKLPGVRFGKASWGDINNNGLLDVIITGQTNSGLITRIFINNNGNYSPLQQSFPGLKHSDVAWADFNNDGYLDFIIAGETSHGMPFTRYYLGSKGMRFIEASSRGIRQLMHASIDVGDFNNDNFVDFVITGESLERPYTLVFENQNGKGFRDLVAGLPGVSNGIAKWGDYDRDGDLDLYIAGVDVCFNLISAVFRNTLDRPRDDVEVLYVETIPLELASGPYYYFVFSSCFCDPEGTGTKSYNAFVSNIHKEPVDFQLTYKFNELLINRFPGWPWSDRGHRTSNAFTSIKDAEEGRKTVIGGYSNDGFKLHYLNW
ncbi:MAG: hypothetical protein CVT92_15680 [Bacteroidetes bacterium HGW-Bacteroidetes-1]|nr:MAG: hypothetical protein CVT92_15680 [Bacteroidetes bacterium HGW-Bacteroidetes-1]